MWNHLVVAQLRWVFDVEKEEASMSLQQNYLDDTFPGVIAHWLVEE